MNQPPIPALIVSGYLGSGKTTLVSHLLAEAQAEGIRVAIISNEFGNTGIDRALLDAGEEGFVELDGGCVCCRLSDALGETLQTILTQVKPDRLILECSGIALPGEVVLTFWRPPVSDAISDEAVVVLVDGERFLREGVCDDTFGQQIEAADVILLNKTDLMTPNQIRAVSHTLNQISGRDVHPVTQSKAPFSLFFPDQKRTTPDKTAQHSPHSHDRFTTIELSYPGLIDEAALINELSERAAVRTKGFIQTDRGTRVVQGVGARITCSDAPSTVSADLIGKIVLIDRAAPSDRPCDAS